jgi:acyl dehydratase
MINSVSNATHAQPEAQPSASSKTPAPFKPQPTAAPTDTVTISAAKQIVQEAATGDNQAKSCWRERRLTE